MNSCTHAGRVNIVDATGMRLYRKRRQVVDLPMLTIEPGVTALLGPNGAGKTTLLETIATALPLRYGTIKVGGLDVTNNDERALIRRCTGFLPQHFAPPGSFVVIDYLSYVAWTKEVPVGQLEVAGWRALEAVDLVDRGHDRIKTLSGGMRQRLGIAAALVHEPTFLILDEPTAGLDPAQRHQFRQIIANVGERASTLLSTHLTDDVEAICDKVVIMDRGAVHFEGTTAELMHAGSDVTHDADANRQGGRLEAGYLAIIART